MKHNGHCSGHNIYTVLWICKTTVREEREMMKKDEEKEGEKDRNKITRTKKFLVFEITLVFNFYGV